MFCGPENKICARIASDLSASFIRSFLMPPDWNVFPTEAICHESKKITHGKQSLDYFLAKELNM